MRPRIVYTIFAKEVIDTLRDRRALFAMFILPALLYPILFTLLGELGASGEAQRRAFTPRVVTFGTPPARIAAALTKEFGTSINVREAAESTAVLTTNARALVENGEAEVVIVVPPRAELLLAGDDSLPIEIYYDESKSRSDEGHDRVKHLVDTLAATERDVRLRRHNLPAGFNHPVSLVDHDLADKRRRGGQLAGQILPFILIFVMVLGGLLPAVDLTAGEKERGTLQTLLCAPVHTVELVAGKYLTVVTLSLAGAAANLGAMGYTLSRQLHALGQGAIEFHLDLRTALGLFAAMLPLALLFAALLLALAVFARSFREANSYLSPVMMAMSFPALAALLPGMDLDARTAFIPVVNVALLIREMLGGHVSAQLYLEVVFGNLVYASLGVMFAARVFETEQVLLGGESPWRDLFGNRARLLRTPSPRQAAFFAALLLVVVYHGSLWMIGSGLHAITSLAILQSGLMLAPAIAFVALSKLSLRETFSLTLPTRGGLLGTILFAAGAWSISACVESVQTHIFPNARQHYELFNQALDHLDAGIPALILVVAVLPAIAEEACFRGVILAGFANTGSRLFAIAGSGILFGLFHLDPHHALATALLGMLFAQAALSSGSLLPSVSAHFVNNALAVLLLKHPSLGKMQEATPLLAAGVVCTFAGLWLLRGSRKGN